MKAERVDKVSIYRHVIGSCLWERHIADQDNISINPIFKDMFFTYGYDLDMKKWLPFFVV